MISTNVCNFMTANDTFNYSFSRSLLFIYIKIKVNIKILFSYFRKIEIKEKYFTKIN